MGIKSLNKFLRTNCPEVFEEVHLTEYAFKKIAVDLSLYLCKFKTICGDQWLRSFVNFVACLRRNEIHCVFCYDNGSVPEKAAEKEERAEAREKFNQRVFDLEEALETYHKTGEIEEILVDLYAKRRDKSPPKKRLLKRPGPAGEEKVNMNWVESKIKKMRGYILQISEKDFELTRQLFDILDVPWLIAPLEGETLCADLCKRGLVDAVLSEDTDVMAYGCPVFLSKINLGADTCIRVKHPDILEGLELPEEHFLDLCIMCGTDYNKNIFRVGPQKAYEMIKRHGCIDSIAENTVLDVSVLNHKRVRELFRDYPRVDIEKVKYCGTPDFPKLQEFVFRYNVRMDVAGLRAAFVHNVVVFEDSPQEEEIIIEEEEEV